MFFPFGNANSGYDGYSMSVRAKEAYANEEMPITKWTKTAIIEQLEGIETDEVIVEAAKRLHVDELRNLFLFKSSWHHTSKCFNETDFYSVDPTGVTVDVIEDVIRNRKPKAAPEPVPLVLAEVEYGEWEGSRNRPKLVNYSSLAVIAGKWAYVYDGYGNIRKKKVDGSHFEIVKKYDRAPKGTAKKYNALKKVACK